MTLEIWLESKAVRRRINMLKKRAADRDDVFGTVVAAVTCYECRTVMEQLEELGQVECPCCGLKHESELKYRNENHIYSISHMSSGRLCVVETGPPGCRLFLDPSGDL